MKVSYLILDFNRPDCGRALLDSLHRYANHEKEIVYMCNGGLHKYACEFYDNGLIDTLILKKNGDGGGFGQTDLFRYCKTDFAFFVQVDNCLIRPITDTEINKWTEILRNPLGSDYRCIDLNGDQSGRGVWTDRPHFINVTFFNSLGPFPNFGPGLDNGLWNEEYLQRKFSASGFEIYHEELYFGDMGKWSVRQAGDGLFEHRCDTKQLWVCKTPSAKTDVYPPLNDEEWELVLNNKWVGGTIPEAWKKHSFRVWQD